MQIKYDYVQAISCTRAIRWKRMRFSPGDSYGRACSGISAKLGLTDNPRWPETSPQRLTHNKSPTRTSLGLRCGINRVRGAFSTFKVASPSSPPFALLIISALILPANSDFAFFFFFSPFLSANLKP